MSSRSAAWSRRRAGPSPVPARHAQRTQPTTWPGTDRWRGPGQLPPERPQRRGGYPGLVDHPDRVRFRGGLEAGPAPAPGTPRICRRRDRTATCGSPAQGLPTSTPSGSTGSAGRPVRAGRRRSRGCPDWRATAGWRPPSTNLTLLAGIGMEKPSHGANTKSDGHGVGLMQFLPSTWTEDADSTLSAANPLTAALT